MTYHNILIAPANQIPEELLRLLFVFRHEVFVTRLGWVPPRGTEEVDFFDTLGPVHAICQDRHGSIVAAARLLPTSGPTMLRDIFPDLLGGTACPSDDRIWEISRFALCPSPGPAARHRHILLEFVHALFRFAQSGGIHRLVAVSDTRLERLVSAATGLALSRLAPPQQLGSCRAVAGFADVTDTACSYLADRLNAPSGTSERTAA